MSTAAQSDSGFGGIGANPWFILASLFLGQMLAVGAVAYGFGLLVKPISDEYGLARADVNIGMMLMIVGMAAASPLIGRGLDRLAANRIVPLGAVLFAAGCCAVAWLEPLWIMAVAAFFLVATGTAILGPLTCSTLVARAFDEGRGRALGVVSISASAGGLLLMPFMAMLVEMLGWRTAVALIGVIVLALMGTLGLMLRLPAPAAAAAEKSGRNPASASGWTFSTIIRTSDFWLIAMSIGLVLAVNQALLASLIAYGTDRGFSLQAATLVISIISGAAILGKLIIGALSDRIDPRLLYLLALLLNALLLVTLLLNPPYTLLLGAAALAGIGFGGAMPLWAAFIANRFGVVAFGTVMGLMIPLQMPMNIAGLRYVGHIHDSTGSYAVAFLSFLVVLALAALSILSVRRTVQPALGNAADKALNAG